MTMLLPLLGAFSGLAALAFGHPSATHDRAYQLGRWRLDVHEDTFRHQFSCRLTDDYGHFPKVTAGQDALRLKLPSHADGSLAWFSVDGAPARPWRDVEAALIADGSLAQAESLDNATGGVLALPYAAVSQAQTITVQLSRKGRLLKYSVVGLWPMMAAAERQGCDFRDGR